MNRHGLSVAGALFGCLVSLAVAADDGAGKAVFERWCVHCHGEQPAAPGTLRLGWNRGAGQALLERRRDLDPAYIATTVRHGYLEMPSFRATEVSDAELAALVRYLGTQP